MICSLLAAATLTFQEPVVKDSAFFRKGDGVLAIAAAAATGVTAVFDERIARWARGPSVQGDSSRRNAVEAATVVNEVPLTIGALATYGVGRLAHHPVLADVGAHWSEALVATVVLDETLRIAIGRTRPRSNPDNAFAFHPGGGLSHFDERSFPSLHSAVAFATAAALSEEMRIRNVHARSYVGPLPWVAATIPGFTRIYLDQHWTSDIVAGSALGAFVGARVVHYQHGRATMLDRILLHASVVPDRRSARVAWSFAR
jgi:membrane-associated phospholipid phosphatase